ncbi:MAG: T9SS type A sorting domain-containing protein [Bacteroidota bacterium]|jgi:hypothetical protein
MSKRFFTIFFVALFSLSLSLSVAAEKKFERAQKAANENVQSSSTTQGKQVYSKTGYAPIVGAKMWNAYTPQSAYTNNIAYDPYSGVVGLIHRGDRTGLGSGYMYYNVSDDGGLTWTPQIGPMNHPERLAGRHPNILLANSGKSTNAADVHVLVTDNELVAGAFRDVAYLDAALGAGSGNASIDSSNAFSYAGAMDYNTGKAYWPISSGVTNDCYLATSTDNHATVTKKLVIPAADVHTDDSKLVEVSPDGTVWYVERGKFFGVDTVSYIWRVHFSTDGGDTWSTAKYFKPTDVSGYQFASYEWDMISSNSTELHIAALLADTVSAPGTEKDALYDIVIPKSGVITSSKIADINLLGVELPGGLQALSEPEYARTLNGSAIALKWIDATKANMVTAADSVRDVFVAKKEGTGAWSAPANVSNSPSVDEVYSNLASIMKDDGQMFMFYTVFGVDDLAEADMVFLPEAKLVLKVNPVSENMPQNFSLGQNYPNPFNPSTKISYTVSVAGSVDISVYNMLGQKITTLVNENHGAGEYQTEWNGKNSNGTVVPSGMYFYTMRTGQFESTKKMMLLK